MFALLVAVTIASTPPLTVTAKVVTEDGTPIANARVSVWDSTFATDGVSFTPSGAAEALWGPTVGVTGSDGVARFAFKDARHIFSSAPRFAIAVDAPGRAPAFLTADSDGKTLDVGVVKLERGAELHLRLVCDDSPCPADFPLQISVESPWSRTDTRNGRAGPDGVASFAGLRAGKGQARLHWKLGQPGERAAELPFVVEAGQRLELTMEATRTGAGLEISGTVVDPLKAAGLHVFARCGRASRSAAVAANGSFKLVDLPKGECVVTASEPMTYESPEFLRSVEQRIAAGTHDAALTLPLKAARERRR